MTMTRKLQILLLEDRAAEAELIMRELRKEGIQFEGKRVATKPDFLAQLRDFAPDIILAAYSIPSCDGLSALAASLTRYWLMLAVAPAPPSAGAVLPDLPPLPVA